MPSHKSTGPPCTSGSDPTQSRWLLRRTCKDFLKTHVATVAGRTKFAAGKYTTYKYSDISCSQYWRQARRMFHTELFNPKRLESYKHIRREELKVFIRELYDPVNKAIALKDPSLLGPERDKKDGAGEEVHAREE